MDFLKNDFNRGLDIGSLGVKNGINFLGKKAGNHYENGKRVTSKNWNGNDKFVKDGNIQKRTVNRQKSNIMSARAEVFGFLKETVNDNSVNPELVNASRILLENYDLLNDNCINDLHRGWTEYINNRANQQLINEFGKYILEVASSVERENVFSFLEQNKNKNDLGRGIIENIHALLHDRDLIDKEAISSLYSAITSNNAAAVTQEITTAASRIKLQKVISILEGNKNNNSLDRDILENIRALLHDRDLIDKEAIGSLYSAITSNNAAAIIREITTAASRIKPRIVEIKLVKTAASRIKLQRIVSFLEQNKNNNNLDRDIIENIRALLHDRDLIDKEAISSLYSAITSNNDTAITREITTAASRIKLQKVISILEGNKNNNSLDRDILENIHALLHDRNLIDKEAISSLYSAITSNNDTAITREITTAASRIKLQKVISILEQNKNNNSLDRDILENIHALLRDRDLIDKEAIGPLYSAITSNNDTAITREITTAASRIKLQKIVSFLEQNKNNNNLRKDIIENIRALLHDRDLIDKEAIGSLYSAITSNNAAAIIREITTAASRIKPRIVEIKLVKIVPNLEDKDDEYDVNPKNNLSTINNINTEDTDIEPSGDSVFHIAEAIIATTANLGDKELRSNEKEFTADEIESELRSFLSSAKSMFKNTPLYALDILKVESTALKRVRTKVLAKVCTDAFNNIKDDKDIQKCVNDLSDALIRYSKSETFENCKKIILIQEKLREAIKNYKHIESVNEVLNTVFIRAAVDKFYKKFGDLSNPNAISRLKSIFNSIYDKSDRIASIEKDSSIDFDTHLDNLIYGFGFVPSSVDIELKNLAGENVGMREVLSALKALSKEHALTIKNGKKFEVVNTGSYNDRNCAFRAISIGAGFGPNGYNIIQQKVVECAQKLLEMWDGLDRGLQMQITRMLGERVGTFYYLSDVKKLLKKYIDCHGKGFVSGVLDIEFLFAAISLGHPICVSDDQLGKEYTFLPDGRKEDGIRNDYSTFGKPVYVGKIYRHAEALLPLDNKGLQKMDNKLPELDKKASEMKDAISKHISGAIYEAINGRGSLLKIILRKMDSKFDADKKAEAYSLENEIRIIAKNKASGKLDPSQEEVLQNKLKQFGDIFADKAVELCKEEPLFWDNVRNSIPFLW